MASAALSMVNSSPLQANGRGFSEFAGLHNTSASAPFARKASHLDLLSVVAFQTSAANLEYLGRVVFNSYGMLYPDSVVGTDSHTTMIDGLGVAGWGVGCIEAEAVMLGQRGRLEEQVRQHNERRAAAISEMNDSDEKGKKNDDNSYEVTLDEDFLTALEYGMPPASGMHILHELADNCLDIATEKSGCCVLQHCLTHSQGEPVNRLVAKIAAKALVLSHSRYGNYVVQFILAMRNHMYNMPKQTYLRTLRGTTSASSSPLL